MSTYGGASRLPAHERHLAELHGRVEALTSTLERVMELDTKANACVTDLARVVRELQEDVADLGRQVVILDHRLDTHLGGGPRAC